MQFKKFLLAVLISVVSVNAWTLTNVLDENSAQLSTFIELLKKVPGLATELASATKITVLAPTNDAFKQLEDTQPDLSTSTALITNLLKYHVLVGPRTTTDIRTSKNPLFVPTLLTDAADVLVTGGQRVEGSYVEGAVRFTSGYGSFVRPVKTDLSVIGGSILHIVDNVLTIPNTLIQTLRHEYITLLPAALIKAGLVDTLESTKDVTFFAPEDTAFSAVQAYLDGASAEELISILQYHVVVGRVAYSTTLVSGEELTTLNGATLVVHIEETDVFINSAKVTIPDYLFKGGVIHVIESILLPPNVEGPPTTEVPVHKTGPFPLIEPKPRIPCTPKCFD